VNSLCFDGSDAEVVRHLLTVVKINHYCFKINHGKLKSTINRPYENQLDKKRISVTFKDKDKDRRHVMAEIGKQRIAIIILTVSIFFTMSATSLANMAANRIIPGEKLTYALHWENIPAGELQLEIRPITTIGGIRAYHFVMTVRSNSAVDFFVKIRDRIDAYADIPMNHSIYYQKGQSGESKREEVIEFDWQEGKARYTDTGRAHASIDLTPGSFDPLSAFYFTRMMISEETPKLERPVTDGKRNFVGNASMVRREIITLKNGKTYDTFCLKPDMGLFGGVFKESKNAQLLVWVTADEKRIPVQIKSKVKVGYFIGELVSVEGV
jgi:hypothetical protein